MTRSFPWDLVDFSVFRRCLLGLVRFLWVVVGVGRILVGVFVEVRQILVWFWCGLTGFGEVLVYFVEFTCDLGFWLLWCDFGGF